MWTMGLATPFPPGIKPLMDRFVSQAELFCNRFQLCRSNLSLKEDFVIKLFHEKKVVKIYRLYDPKRGQRQIRILEWTSILDV